MKFDSPLPDAARQMLAQFGRQIEYTENEPNGLVDLTKSEVGNEDHKRRDREFRVRENAYAA